MSEEKKIVKYNKYQQGDVVMFQVDNETFDKYANARGSDILLIIIHNLIIILC